jgi:plastocyanin
MMVKKIPTFAFLLLALLGSGQVGAETIHVDIQKFKFIPQQLTVAVGDTVIWTNKEKRQYHSVWFKGAGDPEPDYFFPDETYQRTFSQVGTFNYECGPHPKMTGIITVK